MSQTYVPYAVKHLKLYSTSYFTTTMPELSGIDQSSLEIRTDSVPGTDVFQFFSCLWRPLDTAQIALTMTISWQIWKSCCSKIFASIDISHSNTLQGVAALSDITRYEGFVRNLHLTVYQSTAGPNSSIR
ncbi:hypothetical protein FCM35_KLT17447 [Carex littledalei]|uniref:Uncharacterized protein n=1 Tax=Carex littledalei TaxID=544730 RepID=A0A833VRF2_9POAL|nr:hypothetical protein FCM35_KLT17447 [Carex littledalei]